MVYNVGGGELILVRRDFNGILGPRSLVYMQLQL
jgi:hypothetical protein